MLYPLGIQDFEDLRLGGRVYVDKTDLIYRMVTMGKYYFLSRPRRFGKSLLMSTIEAYFLGKKELFNGLAMERLEQNWTKHPVLHLDLNNGNYASGDGLTKLLEDSLNDWEEDNNVKRTSDEVALRFKNIIKSAYNQTGQKVVVLIDEYDKPMLESIGNKKLQDEFRNILKPFYGTLKTCDKYIRFGMLTGVTKFGKLSVFSDLNNLEDISLIDEYSWICGISEEDVVGDFAIEIEAFAQKKKITVDEMYRQLRMTYDGYHFSKESPGMYNPFSLLNALKNKDVRSYWFSTGTPTYLVKLLQAGNYDLSKLEGVEVEASVLESVDPDSKTPVSVIYQSGYLTIKGYNQEFQTYTLGFPNREVEEGFFKFLLPNYTNKTEADTGFNIRKFVEDLRSGNADGFMLRMQSFYADNSHILEPDKERHFRNVFYIICKLLGYHVEAEYMTSEGRSDLVIKTPCYIYVMEFKYNVSSEAAIKQIEDKNYALPFAVDGRQIIKIGCNFNPSTGTLDQWIIQK